MKYDFEEKLFNGNTHYYKQYEGTYYSAGMKLSDGTIEDYETSDSLIAVLKRYENKPYRIRIWYGNKQTGEAWNEEYDIAGTIGRSSGTIKVPILLKTKNSHFGGAILVGNIIRIDDIKDKRTLWQADNFHIGKMEVEIESGSEYPYRVMQHKDSGEVQNVANFKDSNAALRWIDFMNGDRYCK